MKYRSATLADAPVLALLNQQLIRDEGHTSRRTLADLETRMAAWLQNGYHGILFEDGPATVGYALFRRDSDPDSIYLRQFFIHPEFRRKGLGREAIRWLIENPWKGVPRIRLDVLVSNSTGRKFWQAVGFAEYCITMERQHA